MIGTMITSYLAGVLFAFALLFWASFRVWIAPGRALIAALLWFITLPLAAVIIYRAAKLIAESGSACWSGPRAPWDVWKPEEVAPGRWQAVFDRSVHGATRSRLYDNEMVITFEGRHRAARIGSLASCQYRCNALNGGYAQTVRDERSANPIEEDRYVEG